MKKSLLFMFAALLLVGTSCNNSKKETTPETTTPEVVDNHTAKTSLDYIGTYEGELPAADAQGMKVTIELVDANNYVKTVTFIGKDGGPFIDRGAYKWNEAENTIILEGIKDAPDKYFVGENKLTQLDMEGNLITGDLADKYVLTKK